MLTDVYFFMTAKDLRETFAAFAASEPLIFVPVKRYDDPKDIVSYSLETLPPSIGVAVYGSELQEDRLLVMKKGVAIGWIKTDHTDSTVSFTVNSGANPDCLVVWQGGRLGADCIIRGHFRPSSDSSPAVSLYRGLKRIMKERCCVHNKHFLGQEAVARLRQGARLTHSVSAAGIYDFRLPE